MSRGRSILPVRAGLSPRQRVAGAKPKPATSQHPFGNLFPKPDACLLFQLLLAPALAGLNWPCRQVGWEAEEGVRSPGMDRGTPKLQLPCLSPISRPNCFLELVFSPFAPVSTSCDSASHQELQ